MNQEADTAITLRILLIPNDPAAVGHGSIFGEVSMAAPDLANPRRFEFAVASALDAIRTVLAQDLPGGWVAPHSPAALVRDDE